MIMKLFTKLFGSKAERDIKRLGTVVAAINALEPQMEQMTDEALTGQTALFRERLKAGETLDDLLPEAFATVREASRRVLHMRHYDCQLIGGMTLHSGKIAEMKTGEGKTLVATLAAYLNALSGNGVHVVTVNDYLAQRDAEWMGKLYRFLGLTVDTIVHGKTDAERIAAYRADITYGTNNEFGFDYLRDNMKFSGETLVMRDLKFAIVDEVDSILIDEARTPLIISGPAEKSTSLYYQVNTLIPRLKKDDDFTVDEKARSASLTEEGVQAVEKLLKVENLYDPKHMDLLHHVNQALKAHALFKRDVDYIVKDGQVVIVDEFTGRLMPGRRYSDGLHQALEAKENVKIENENQTLATITFQNYFRMYDKLSGMTGTAETEAEEFYKIYGLEVLVIPTHLPMIRKDYADSIYKTRKEKFDAVIEEIIACNKTGQPVLVGTVNIDVSESLSRKLKRRGVPHNVLNAKHHSQEAQIVSQAGQMGAVTISTNMAGRGTDIVLGEGVLELGGLHIIGTERHESRRIDNQLRGRSGRQGDPGSSRFFLALEDDLLRIFGGERISSIMERLGLEDGEPIEHRMISRAIENAQKKVEGHNFDIRKQLIEYDDVINEQREVIYKQRRQALTGENLREFVTSMIAEKCDEIAERAGGFQAEPKDWDMEMAKEMFLQQFAIDLVDDTPFAGAEKGELGNRLYEVAIARYEQQETAFDIERFRQIENFFVLQTVDNLWKDHLLNMDHLKEGIGLRGYAQQNPLLVYKKEAFKMFQDLIVRIKEEILGILFRIQLAASHPLETMQAKEEQKLNFSHGDASEQKKTPVRADSKVGRNDPCPCGSGKKFKKCCGA
ncbi:MAG: preprotein translocase subunit SecA [Deltaproteobacteria bacterium]|nr:MAG: preprotein translocase subunit SecA [Deltaproteobacteria bacterium]